MSLQQFISQVSSKTRQRGLQYFRQGRVLSCEAGDDEWNGVVVGSRNYHTCLYRDPETDEWFGDCNCPVGEDCKHAVALAYYILEKYPDVHGSNKKTKTTAKRNSGTSRKEKDALDQLKAFWKEKNGKLPTAAQSRLLNSLANLYARWLQDDEPAHVHGGHFNGILKPPRYGYGHRPIPLPVRTARSLSVVEFWHVLLERAQDSDYTLAKPKQWESISRTDESKEALRLVEVEEDRETARRWLEEFAQQPEIPDRPVDIHLRIGGGKALVFVQEPGKKKPIRITSSQWFELGKSEFIGPAGQAILSLLKGTIINRGEVELSSASYSSGRNHLARLMGFKDVRPRLCQNDGQPLQWVDQPAAWKLECGDDSDRFILMAGEEQLKPIELAFPGSPSQVICGGTVYQIPPIPTSWVEPLEKDAEVHLPSQTLLSPGGLKLCRQLQIPLPEEFKEKIQIRHWQVEIQAEIVKTPYRQEVIAVKCLAHSDRDQGNPDVQAEFTSDGWQKPPINRSQPDAVIFEDAWKGGGDLENLLNHVGPTFERYSKRWELPCREEAVTRLADWAVDCDEARVLVRGELAALLKPPARASLKVEIEESGRDWFDVEARMESSEEDLTDEEMEILMKGQGRWVRLPKKGWRRMEVTDPEAWDESLADLGITLGPDRKSRQRLHALQLASAAEKDLLAPDAARSIRKRIDSIQTSVAIPVPSSIRAELRPYQRDGLNFLAYLSTNGFGGILADDMGLGKTLQSLAWLAWLYNRRGKDSPAGSTLVICPKSVVDNWVTETEKFFPGMKAKTITTGTAEKDIGMKDRKSLVVMNYAQLRRRREFLTGQKWGAVILDEGQYIKNPGSQTARAAFQLQSDHRLVLTGTPVENRLTDLWSLMNFSMPGILGDKASFKILAGDGSDPIALRRVSVRLKPFFLRRTKQAVAADLPDRIEEDINCTLEGIQKKHYDAELKKARLLLSKVRSASDFNEARFNILTSLLRLRQICCHPALVHGDSHSDDTKSSAKLEALQDLLEPLRAEGEKVLIFSQFTSLLDIVKSMIEKEGTPVWSLTGKTNRRSELVENFRKAEGHGAFLISLKAGGTGLNLTEAAYVIMLDPWWNPAVENQAIDRTHRIGQTRTVIAYRLIAADTIEQKIRQLQRDKKHLAESVLGEASADAPLSMDDFRFLLEA